MAYQFCRTCGHLAEDHYNPNGHFRPCSAVIAYRVNRDDQRHYALRYCECCELEEM